MKSKKNTDRLLSLIQRIERLEEEKRSLQQDIAEVFKEAKAAGFDTKIVRIMIRERRMSEGEREEQQALLDMYRAALGMLDGTPLGDAARRRLMQQPDPPPAGSEDAPERPPGGDGAFPQDQPDLGLPPAPEPPTAEEIAAARAEGAAAAKAERRVTDNPHPAGDPRRGAWDEGWCAQSASDGMDVPAAWRRTKPSKSAPPPAPPGGGS